MKRVIMIAMVIGILATGGIAMASPLEPALGLLPVAGEAQLNAFFPFNRTDQCYVDWMVLNPGTYADTAFESLVQGVTGGSSLTQYLYAYQVESRAISPRPQLSNIENMTLYFDPYGTSSTAGSLFGTDLDVWHNSNLFANLATEGEANATLENVHFGPAWALDNMTWDYDGFLNSHNPLNPHNEESTVMWIMSPYSPKYNPVAVNDTAQTGGKVPTPVTPEPASAMLLGMGLIGFAGRAVRKFMA